MAFSPSDANRWQCPLCGSTSQSFGSADREERCWHCDVAKVLLERERKIPLPEPVKFLNFDPTALTVDVSGWWGAAAQAEREQGELPLFAKLGLADFYRSGRSSRYRNRPYFRRNSEHAPLAILLNKSLATELPERDDYLRLFHYLFEVERAVIPYYRGIEEPPEGLGEREFLLLQNLVSALAGECETYLCHQEISHRIEDDEGEVEFKATGDGVRVTIRGLRGTSPKRPELIVHGVYSRAEDGTMVLDSNAYEALRVYYKESGNTAAPEVRERLQRYLGVEANRWTAGNQDAMADAKVAELERETNALERELAFREAEAQRVREDLEKRRAEADEMRARG